MSLLQCLAPFVLFKHLLKFSLQHVQAAPLDYYLCTRIQQVPREQLLAMNTCSHRFIKCNCLFCNQCIHDDIVLCAHDDVVLCAHDHIVLYRECIPVLLNIVLYRKCVSRFKCDTAFAPDVQILGAVPACVPMQLNCMLIMTSCCSEMACMMPAGNKWISGLLLHSSVDL